MAITAADRALIREYKAEIRELRQALTMAGDRLYRLEHAVESIKRRNAPERNLAP